MPILRLLGVMGCVAAGALLNSAKLPERVLSAVLVNHAYAVSSNIIYKVAHNHDLKLDVYRPHSSPAPVPGVTMIHGGGWISSNKDDYVLTAGPYLAMGFGVVNVEYRLGKVRLAPAAVEDCLCALRWIGVHAKEYNFDLDEGVVTGASAGGHLALATGIFPASAGFANECASIGDAKDTRPRVSAIINRFGITDVADLLQEPNMRAYAVSWLGSQPAREDLANRLSPLTCVRPGVPPVLTIPGDADPTVPYSHAVRLHDALTKAAVRNQLLTLPGGDHGSFTVEQDILAFETTRSFLESLGIGAVSR